ncbi:fimbrial protein YehD [Escherichia fergusonii]|uniref:fimbrial protein YehD n=1 Tax=Escherichia fergusonii TaxID=564 RepID=UPI00352513AD
MKRSIIAATVISTVVMSAGVFAADTQDQGKLEIKGKIVGTTCEFIGSNSAEIILNELGADKINSLPAGGVYDGVTNSTAVPLKIKCEANKTPRITFSATQFDNNDITLNNGDAKGVGFAVYHGDTNTKVDPQTGVSLEKNSTGDYELNFLARYARNTDAAVESGNVNSTLTLTVVTD